MPARKSPKKNAYLNLGNTRGHLWTGLGAAKSFEIRKVSQADLKKKLKGFERIYLCSVVPSFSKRVKTVAKQIKEVKQRDVPLKVDYKKGLGMDRLMNAYAAHVIFPEKSWVIVDIGTAITVDFLRKDGRFLGGWISVGPRLAAKSLARGTEQLPEVLLRRRNGKDSLGKSTKDALGLGNFHSVKGLLSEAKRVGKKILGPDAGLILTGGDAESFRSASMRYEPLLTLKGLACLAQSEDS